MRTDGYQGQVDVSYSTNDGTALKWDDSRIQSEDSEKMLYYPATGTVTFEPGDTEKEITLNIVKKNSLNFQNDMTFTVVLSTKASEASLGTRLCTIVLEPNALAKEISKQVMAILEQRIEELGGINSWMAQIRDVLTLPMDFNDFGDEVPAGPWTMTLFVLGMGWVSAPFISSHPPFLHLLYEQVLTTAPHTAFNDGLVGSP